MEERIFGINKIFLFLIIAIFICIIPSVDAANSKSPVGIADSTITRNILKNTDNVYGFTGADGKTHYWLKGKYAYLAPYGAYEVFEALGIPYSVLDDPDLENMEVLSQLKVLVLPRTLYISDTAAGNIAAWVKSGGILIGTEQVGIYSTASGTERGEPALSSLFGIDYLERVSKTKTSIYITNTSHPVWKAGYQEFNNNVYIGDETTEKLAETVAITAANGTSIAEYRSDSIKFGEAVVVNSYGQGKTLYMAPSLFEYTIGAAQYHYDFMFDDYGAERGDVYEKQRFQQLGEETILIVKNFLEAELNFPVMWISSNPAGYNATLTITHDCDGTWSNAFRDYAEPNGYTETYWTRPDTSCKSGGLTGLSGTKQEHGDHFDSYSGLSGKKIYNEIAGWDGGGTVLGYDKTVTAGKHWNPFWYPEAIDAMKYAYDNLPSVIGLRSFHPGCIYCYIYGIDAPGSLNYYGLGLRRPYRVVVAEKDYTERLRGYDHTEYFELYETKDITNTWERYNGVYVLSFHTDNVYNSYSTYTSLQQIADKHGGVWKRSYEEIVRFTTAVRSLNLINYSQTASSYTFEFSGNALPSDRRGMGGLNASIKFGPFSSAIKGVYLDNMQIGFKNETINNRYYAIVEIDDLPNHVVKFDVAMINLTCEACKAEDLCNCSVRGCEYGKFSIKNKEGRPLLANVTANITNGEFEYKFTPILAGIAEVHAECANPTKTETTEINITAKPINKTSLPYETQTVGLIMGGERGIFTYENNVSVTKIYLQATNTLRNVGVNVTKNTTQPSAVTAVPGNVYAYLKIEKTNATDGDIANVTIRFKVERHWVDANSVGLSAVTLYRYANDWVPLATTKISCYEDYCYFESISPGLSFFAIAANRIITITTVATSITTTTLQTTTTVEAIENQQPKFGNEPLVLAVVAAASICLIYYYLKNRATWRRLYKKWYR